MRTSLLLTFLLCACDTAPKHFVAPSTIPAHTAIDSAASAASRAKTEIKRARAADNPAELHMALDRAEGEIDSLTGALLDANKSLSESDKKMGVVVDLANKAEAGRVAAVKQAAFDKTHVHKLKLGICGVAAAATFLLLLNFSSFVMLLGPYGLAIFVLGPAAVAGFLWFKL